MQFSVRTKVILIGLLVLLGLVFRFPTTPHEIGWDSFAVHLMANSVSEFGYAKWWLHPTSIMGSYPYSTTPSAVAFILSGITQCINIDMESTILLYSMILGIFSIFAVYLMAGVIWNNDIFKFLAAFVFSASQGIITKTTWTGHSRTLFIIALPLFIYLLLSTRTFKVRFGVLTFIVFVLFSVTHHFTYFVIPIIIGYLVIVMFYTAGKYFKSIRIPENFANFAMLGCFLIMFVASYFNRSLWWSDPAFLRSEGASSVYVWLSDVMLEQYVRYIGVLIILVVSGYIYLVFKRNKRFEEWVLLMCIAGLAPLLYIATYAKWFVLPFACLLIGIALTNIVGTEAKKKKYRTTFVIILLLSSIIFTGYYQYLHFLNDPDPHTRYLEERTYVGGLWMKDNIDKNKNMISDNYIGHRVFSTSEVPTLTGVAAADLAYGFVDPGELEVEQFYSPYSVDFYFKDPYDAINDTYTHTDWHVNQILMGDINDHGGRAYRFTQRFNLSYYIENKDIRKRLSQSVQQTKDCFYDNGKICVWDLN